MDFSTKKVGIWGFGIVGKSALNLFSTLGASISVIDNRTLTRHELDLIEQAGARHLTYDNLQQFLHEHDLIVPSPGVDLRPFEQFKRKFIAELDIFGTFFNKPIIAITGTIGKTSSTQLLSHILTQHGLRIAAGGNLGIGMFDFIAQQQNYDLAILEVSSFQLDLCRSFAPDVALWINFFPNHLDRHSSLQEYFDAKQKIFISQKANAYAIAPLALAPSMRKDIQSHHIFFSASNVDAAVLEHLDNNSTVFFVRDNHIVQYHQNKLRDVIALNQLHTTTFIENNLAIVATLFALRIPTEALCSSPMFIPERHRLEKVMTINNIDFYNDSKATIPQATLGAIERLKDKPILLLVGGLSKGVDRTPLFSLLKNKISKIICFGAEAQSLHQHAVNAGLQSYACATLEEACSYAFTIAQPGDQVVFSPAGSSFDLFKNYQERGNKFKELVIAYYTSL